ncbi:MAG: hypothetical protein KDA20_09550 [Phycisphaerales bacterium]|nr:hypothetical protein [Phycisphaerales bacterium]
MNLIRSRATRLALAACAVAACAATSLSANTITYQGHLEQNGLGVSGTRNMAFSLWNSSAGGAQIGATITINNVPVDDGLFQVDLDFTGEDVGSTTTNRWLQVTVNGSILTPRQRLTASPYSLQTRGIYVQNDGDVGIGTTTPNATLHIKKTTPVSAGEPPVSLSLEWQGAVVGTPPRDWLSFRVGGTPLLPAGYDGTHVVRDNDSKLHFTTQVDIAGTLDAPQMTLDTNRRLGINETDPQAELHVRGDDLGVNTSHFNQDVLLVEDADAILGLYSSNGGVRGSAVVLGEVTGGVLADKWIMGRNTTGSGSALYFKYGFNVDPNANSTLVVVEPNGDLDVAGRVLAGPNDVPTAYAYGRVSSTGTLLSATSNVTGVSASGYIFDIAITGYNPSTDVVIATAIGSDDSCSVSNNGNLLRVHSQDLSVLVDGITSGNFWTPAAAGFNFVVYKP